MQTKTCFIDSASIWQVVQFLSLKDEELDAWSIETIENVTYLLLTSDHFHMSPGVGMPDAREIHEYDKLVDMLLVSRLMHPLNHQQSDHVSLAMADAKRWAKSHTGDLTRCAEEAVQEGTQLRNWLEWSSVNAWRWHGTNLHGLFDLAFAPSIQRVLNVGMNDLLDLHRATMAKDKVASVLRQRSEDYNLMGKAYVVSAMIRGKYHDAVANRMNWQILHHPLRASVISGRVGDPVDLQFANTVRILSRKIIDGARRQRKFGDRLSCWAANLVSVRNYCNPDPTLLMHKDSAIRANKEASRIASESGIEMADRGFVSCVEIAAALGIGSLFSASLSPWVGVPAGVATNRILRKTGALSKGLNRAELWADRLPSLQGGRILGGRKRE